MRASLAASAAIPFAALAISALPASADTVVHRETTIIREAPARIVERRYYRAPEVRYYTAPRTTYVAPRRYYTAPRTTYVAPRRYYYTSVTRPRDYYVAPSYDDYVTAGYYDPAPSTYYYNAPGYTYAASLNGCDTFYRRAVATGSTYWWDRYNACED
jgi:hypothetical protein